MDVFACVAEERVPKGQARDMLDGDSRAAFARSLTRVLVLGGYGGFGGRISRRLAAAGHEVIVAGRDEAKARAFCGGDTALVPALVDRVAIAKALAEHMPDTVVDASGPFQVMDYVVPRACIEAGVHYLDIADGRAFVCGIAELNAEAKAAGVIVISGASSVPALSGAVVRQLTAAALNKLKDADGNLLWRESLIVGQPATLLGRPVEIDEGMPGPAAGNITLAFGDFNAGYLINDRYSSLRLLRDPYTNKPFVQFYATKRVGGGLLDPGAIRLLRIPA